MIANVGKLDRALRLVLGAVLLGLGLGYFKLIEPGTVALGAKIVGLALLATATVSFCPAYRLLGVNTCAK